MKLKVGISQKMLEQIGFMSRGTYYYMYNPIWEEHTSMLVIDKYTRLIAFTNGNFAKGEKAIAKLIQQDLIEQNE